MARWCGDGDGVGAYLEDGVLALETDLDAALVEEDGEVAALGASGDGDGDFDVVELLRPAVGQRTLL